LVSAVQQFVMKPGNGVVLGMPSNFSGCSIRAPAAAGQDMVQPAEVRDTMDGRHYRGPKLRGAKHQVGVQTGLLVEEKVA
jgi:hypothetical protein